MVSIIVPIYNAAAYLPQCIESLCGQTYADIQIILVDDGSIDGSSDICDAYARTDERIVVVHQENAGAVNARKVGMAYAAGEYIAFADGDDWMEPHMIESLYQTLVQEEVDIAMCGRFEDTGDVNKEVYHGFAAGKYDKKMLKEIIYPRMIVNTLFFEWGIFPGLWDKLFRRECLERFLLCVDEKITMGDDAACVYPCLLHTDSIYILDQCLYHYRQTENSTVKQKADWQLERQRFHILWKTVYESFIRYRDIYDLTQQWREYLLFLMVPRAGVLLEGIEELDYLFPYPRVKRGSRIIIYGMGTYGQQLYGYLKQTGFCSIAALVDRNYEALREQGFFVEPPDYIKRCKYDAIVIAASFAKTRYAIYRELAAIYGSEKVHCMDEKLVKGETVVSAFGLT